MKEKQEVDDLLKKEKDRCNEKENELKKLTLAF